MKIRFDTLAYGMFLIANLIMIWLVNKSQACAEWKALYSLIIYFITIVTYKFFIDTLK